LEELLMGLQEFFLHFVQSVSLEFLLRIVFLCGISEVFSPFFF